MKSKQILLIALILAALVGAWLIAVNSNDDGEKLEAQSALASQADAFVEKGLYVRAIPLYIEALEYDTENTLGIHDRLMSCYLEYGDTDSYLDLAEARVTAKTADIDIYLTAAEVYVESGDYDEAEALLQLGMDDLGSDYWDKLRACYETFRYANRVYLTDLDSIAVTDGASLLPARNGSNYFFVNDRGSKSGGQTYQFATPFNKNGLSVVMVEDKYYVINDSFEKYAIDETIVDEVLGLSDKYIIAEKDGKVGFYSIDFELISSDLLFDSISTNGNGGWVVSSGGKYKLLDVSGSELTDFRYEDVAINSLGGGFTELSVEVGGKTTLENVAMVKESGKWQLVYQNGEKVFDKGFADAKAPESDGYIAVMNDSGKWGFINSSGETVIDFIFDDAYSFSDELAAVKTDGKWGYISKSGDMVIAAEYDAASPFHSGMAIAERVGKAAIILLELYSE